MDFQFTLKDLSKITNTQILGECRSRGENGSSYEIDYVSSLHAVFTSATRKNNLQINSAAILSSGEKPGSFCTL